MVRQADGAVRVLYNRCAHKGTQLVSDECGNTGKFFRCPYHAWTYRLDGAPLAMPLQERLRRHAAEGVRVGAGHDRRCGNVAVYRDFVFVRLTDGGPGLREILRRGAGRDRQPGRPLAVGRLRDRRRRAAQHHPLQLEDVPREHQRHGASDVDPRVGHAPPPTRCGRASRPMRPSRWRWSRSCPSARAMTSSTAWAAACYAERPQRARRQFQHPLGLRARCPSTRRRCARRTARSAPPRSCSARRRTRCASRAWR